MMIEKCGVYFVETAKIMEIEKYDVYFVRVKRRCESRGSGDNPCGFSRWRSQPLRVESSLSLRRNFTKLLLQPLRAACAPECICLL